MEIEKKLKKEIKEYCQLNNIQDINLFFNQIIKKGFDLEKWGNLNNKTTTKQKKQIFKSEIIEENPLKKEEKYPVDKITNKKQQIMDLNVILNHRDSEVDDFYGDD